MHIHSRDTSVPYRGVVANVAALGGWRELVSVQPKKRNSELKEAEKPDFGDLSSSMEFSHYSCSNLHLCFSDDMSKCLL